MTQRVRRTIVAVVAGLVIAALVIGGRALLEPVAATPVTVIVPPELDATLASWGGTAELPSSLPACLDYDARGAAIVANTDPLGGSALQITLDAKEQPGCEGQPPLTLTEATWLPSLPGEPATVTYDHLEYASAAAPTAGGQTTVTLQWHCGDLMCRLSGATHDPAGATTMLLPLSISLVAVAP